LFGDIFGRDNLDFQSREVVTVAALANLGGVNPQLEAHFSVSLNIGLTEAQLKNLVDTLRDKVDPKVADNAADVLESTLKKRAK
jgi:alkylhydroperoxidase/carboxymuconolactone decarboxylase family protein YurZ